MQSKVIIDLTEDDDSPQRSRETSTPEPRSSALPRTPATTVRVASTPTQSRDRQQHVMARDSAGPSMGRWDLKIKTASLEPSFGALPITPATTASVLSTPAQTGSRERRVTFGNSAAPPQNRQGPKRKIQDTEPASSTLPMTPASAVSVASAPAQTTHRQRCVPVGDKATRLRGDAHDLVRGQRLKRKLASPEGGFPDQSPSERCRKHQRIAPLERSTERRVSMVEAHTRRTSSNNVEAIAVQRGSRAALQAAKDVRALHVAQDMSRHRKRTSLGPADDDFALLDCFIWWQACSID